MKTTEPSIAPMPRVEQTVEIVLETHFIRIAKVISGWDKGAILIQNRATSYEGWSSPIRISRYDFSILMSNLREEV